MGDTTPMTVVIHKVGARGGTKQAREDVADILSDYGLGDSYWSDPQFVDPRDDLRLGEAWIEPEARLGTAEEIVDRLVDLGIPIWFKAQQDAYSPYMGELWMHAPGLGLFTQTCTDEGTPVYTDNEVRDILALRLTDADGDLVERRLGKPWFDEFALLVSRETTDPPA